jgi:exonuclease SbcD
MIRVLHTADWHVGQTLRGFSREYEHRRVFERLEEIVAERNVDALIIAGDVFDSQNPSGEAQQLFYNALVRLSRAQPRMTTVIVAGNHDAAGRWKRHGLCWRHSRSASWEMCGGMKG